MKYIITESQYKLLTEEENILEIPGLEYFGGWEGLQQYLEKKGNPLYKINDDLVLEGLKIKSLRTLYYVGGVLHLKDVPIVSLGKLSYVGDYCDLRGTLITSLGDLEYVGGSLNLFYTDVESFGKLKYVGDNLYLSKTPLSEKYDEDEIRNIINVKGEIYQ
jgi:hypothetical protein